MRVRRTTIPLFWPYTNKGIRTAVRETLKTRWIGQGPKVDEFEKVFGEKFGFDYCVSVNSATSALELAYHLLDLKEGDEVIVPVLTCSATNVPLVRRGVKIVFADIYKNTLCIDWGDVEKKLTAKTRAVVAVNLGGIDAFEGHDISFLRDWGVNVITDSAQKLGETKGDLIVYSFQAIKHITTGDGGMLILPNEQTYQRAKRLRWFGIDREVRKKSGFAMYKGREMTMDIQEVGYKYHMNDIAATMGVEGMKSYDEIFAHRKLLFETYESELECVEGLEIIKSRNSTYWLFTVLVDRRDDFAAMLKKYKIETNLVQVRNDIYTAFGGERLDLPVMNEIEGKYICLPINTNVTLDNVKYICEAIKGGW